MVMNLSKEKLAVFVRFVTGSSVCTGNITIAFNSLNVKVQYKRRGPGHE